MKKILTIILLINFICLPAHSFLGKSSKNTKKTEAVQKLETQDKGKQTDFYPDDSDDAKTEKPQKVKKGADEMDTKGYSGNLPNIPSHFQMYQEQEAEPTFEVDENFNDPYKIKPIPRDNPSFINIILKQDKSSQYINELNELISIIEKIQKTIEDEASLQVFAARAFNLDKYVEFFRNKYQNKPESSYASYKKVMQLNSEVQALAALRREKEVYSPYIVSSSNGNVFSENNINLQTEYLMENIKSTLIILKEAK